MPVSGPSEVEKCNSTNDCQDSAIRYPMRKKKAIADETILTGELSDPKVFKPLYILGIWEKTQRTNGIVLLHSCHQGRAF